jgi:hypothetical protein
MMSGRVSERRVFQRAGVISENARSRKGVGDARRAVWHWQEAGRKVIAFGGLGAPVVA